MNTFNLLGDVCRDDGDRFVQSDVVPAMVIGWLAKQDGDVEININSAGGSVFGGLAIANALKGYSKGKVTANVLGIAASIASVIACACDEIKMGAGAYLMIHNPYSIALGDADALRKEAQTLDTIKASLMPFYLSKFDRSEEELAKMMDDETWIAYEHAAEYGLACSAYVPTEGDGMRAAAKLDTRMQFAKAPKAALEHIAHMGISKPKAEVSNSTDTPAAEAAQDAPEATATEAAETPTEETASAPSAADAPQNEATAEATAEQPAEEAKNAAPCDWEARYKGLQAAKDKELAALRNQLAEATKAHATEIESLKADNAKANEALAKSQDEGKQLREQLAKATKELGETQSALAAETERYRAHVGMALAPAEASKTAAEIAKDPTLSPAQRSKLIAEGKYIANKH